MTTRPSWASRRGRTTSVVAILLGGAAVLIGSTQTWVTATVEGAEIPAKGSEALALLQPLALAGLALALALALVGRALRYVFGALALAIGAGLAIIVAPVVFATPVSSVEKVVTEHTGIAGRESIAQIVSGLAPSAWPAVALAAAIVIALGGVLVIVTGASWRRGTSRYDKPSTRHAAADGPLDAVDSWDELTRGDDPTG